MRINSFPPIISKDSKILILGSVPGAKSLEMKQYYAHPQNKFWDIIFSLTNEKPTKDYSEKIEILKRHTIALWDVIDSCERSGSADSEIRNEINNDVKMLLKKFPQIKAVFCNGQKSFRNLNKILQKDILKIPVILLPSTSPLHTISYEIKLEAWKQIKQYLK